MYNYSRGSSEGVSAIHISSSSQACPSSSLDKDAQSSLSSQRSSNRPLNSLPSNMVANPELSTTNYRHPSPPTSSSMPIRRSIVPLTYPAEGKGPIPLDVRDDYLNKPKIYRKKPKNLFFSILYSIFHIACTIALLRISGKYTRKLSL